MRRTKWKKVSCLLLLCCMMTTLFSGCGNVEAILLKTGLLTEEPEADYSHVTDELSIEGVEYPSMDGYYILHDGRYYGTVLPNWYDEEEYAKSLYNEDLSETKITGHRIGLQAVYDPYIPTLFLENGDSLIYYSKDNVLNYYTFAKMKDLGYSIPVSQYRSTVAGYLYLYLNTETEEDPYANTLLESDTKTTILSSPTMTPPEGKEDEAITATMRLYTISGVDLKEDHIKDGVLTGLKRNGEYQINAAFGSEDYQFTAKADYHFFKEMELYAEADYTSDYNGVYTIPIPDYLTTGYYMLSDGEMFRLIREGDSYDMTNPDAFNKQQLGLDTDYALKHGGGYDEDGQIVDADGNLVSNCGFAYSSKQELNYYSTYVPGALGYVAPENEEEGNILAELPTDTPSDQVVGDTKTVFFKVSPGEEDREFEAGSTLYALLSSKASAPCMVKQYFNGQTSSLDTENSGENFLYRYVLTSETTIKEPFYLAIYYYEDSDMKFTLQDERLTFQQMEKEDLPEGVFQ